MKKDLKPQSKVAAKKDSGTKKAFLLKKHKRKSAAGTTLVCAIVDGSTQKQLCQLSSTAVQSAEECEQLVKDLVDHLNQGKKTLDGVKGELETLKASAST